MSSKHRRICTYNIFEGLDSWNDQRVESFKSWIQAQDLDIVGLNEANGFTLESLQVLSLECGLQYCHLHCANTGFYLGVMSRHVMKVMDTSELSAKMHHGIVHVLVNFPGWQCHVLVTHLTPFEASKRRAEAEAIINYLQPYLKDPLVLLGDLNSLSNLDREAHDHDKMLADVLSKKPKLIRKFCNEDRTIDYTPIDILYSCGLVDKGNTSSLSSTTVPSAANRDDAHIGGRLDYILLGPALAHSSSGRVADTCTIKDATTDFTSDHYPVILDFPDFQ